MKIARHKWNMKFLNFKEYAVTLKALSNINLSFLNMENEVSQSNNAFKSWMQTAPLEGLQEL